MLEDTRHIIPRKIPWPLLGLLSGPAAAFVVDQSLQASQLDAPARAMAGVATLMAVWWVTEAVPLAVTALLPIVLFPALGILPIQQTTARYADKLIFLFMGGLFLGVGLQRWNAHKRLALLMILVVGTGPKRIVAGVMLSAAVLSAMVSNTATTMMMLPIVIAIATLAVTEDTDEDHAVGRRYAVCLLLALAYGASIGGIATITGTPPNGLLVGFMSEEMGIDITYARWLFFGVPVTSVLLPVAWWYLVNIAIPVKVRETPGGRAFIRAKLHALGPMRFPEAAALGVFALTALAWIFHGPIEHLLRLRPVDDATIAIAGALLMFVIPVSPGGRKRILSWRSAERIPWGILLLFGGGLALARGVTNTGLDAWIGAQIAAMGNPGELPLTAGSSTLVVFLTNITSNTATTSTLLPVLRAAGEALGADPALLVIAAAVSASCAFMLPVATPPNAIVFSSGRIPIRTMFVAGLGMNLITIVLVPLLVWALARPMLGL